MSGFIDPLPLRAVSLKCSGPYFNRHTAGYKQVHFPIRNKIYFVSVNILPRKDYVLDVKHGI